MDCQCGAACKAAFWRGNHRDLWGRKEYCVKCGKGHTQIQSASFYKDCHVSLSPSLTQESLSAPKADCQRNEFSLPLVQSNKEVDNTAFTESSSREWYEKDRGPQKVAVVEKTWAEHNQLPKKTGRIKVKAPLSLQGFEEHIFIGQHIVLAGCYYIVLMGLVLSSSQGWPWAHCKAPASASQVPEPLAGAMFCFGLTSDTFSKKMLLTMVIYVYITEKV